MIRIAITPAAFEAIAATRPLGSMGYEADANERMGDMTVDDILLNAIGVDRTRWRGSASFITYSLFLTLPVEDDPPAERPEGEGKPASLITHACRTGA